MDPGDRIQDMLTRNDTLAAETIEQIRADMHKTVVKVCARCGKQLGRIHATVIINDKRWYYCHDNDTPHPTCYMLSSWDNWKEARINTEAHGND